jgi:uncharacterized protein (DUF1800 family)
VAIGLDYNKALIATHRFGLGPRGGSAGDLASAAADPKAFVKAELMRPQAALLTGPNLIPAQQALETFFKLQAEVRKQREANPAAASPAAPALAGNGKAPSGQVSSAPAPSGANGAGASAMASPSAAAMPAASAPAASAPEPVDGKFVQETFRAETLARQQRQFSAEVGFVERWVAFWSNHFCVSVVKDPFIRLTAGAYEREAIRPNVFGRFVDLLMAAEKHQAMLHYLDNAQSVGPNSRAGMNRKLGLNENLAREILELHTLGVAGGYAQEDVTAFARVLTGWTVVGPPGQMGQPGSFVFNPAAHEPGAQRLLGKTYPEGGLEQGEAVLKDLARHASTAKFIATKLVRHFIADEPPPALVDRLTKLFRDTDGDLKALALGLLDAPESWSTPLTKIRTPYEFLIATSRLIGRMPEDPGRINGALNLLGQPIWQPTGPNGFPDRVSVWASPEGLKLRLDLANDIGKRLGDAMNPGDLLQIAFGEAASAQTTQTIRRAESRPQAMALLFMSPEFQRR